MVWGITLYETMQEVTTAVNNQDRQTEGFCTKSGLIFSRVWIF